MATSDIRTTTVLPIVNQEKKYYTCHNCQKSCLRGDPSLIRADGNIYHKTCFKCDVGYFAFVYSTKPFYIY
jgi:hypothetical protein